MRYASLVIKGTTMKNVLRFNSTLNGEQITDVDLILAKPAVSDGRLLISHVAFIY